MVYCTCGNCSGASIRPCRTISAAADRVFPHNGPVKVDRLNSAPCTTFERRHDISSITYFTACFNCIVVFLRVRGIESEQSLLRPCARFCSKTPPERFALPMSVLPRRKREQNATGKSGSSDEVFLQRFSSKEETPMEEELP